MVNINISIPDDLHKELKVKSVLENNSLKNHVVSLLSNKLVNQNIKIKKS